MLPSLDCRIDRSARLLLALVTFAWAFLLPAVVLAQGKQSGAQKKAGPPSAESCRNELDAMTRLVARDVRIEIDSPATRQVLTPFAIRFVGMNSADAVKFKLTAIVAFGGPIGIETQDSNPGVDKLDQTDFPAVRSIASGAHKYLRYTVGFSSTPPPATASATAFGLAPGSVEITTAILARTACGERIVGTPLKRSITFVADPREIELPSPPRGTEATAACATETALLRRLANEVSVDIERKETVRAGEPIKLSWRRGAEPFPLIRHVHIVVATPEAARFTGRGMLPVPPGAPAPSGIEHAAGKLRTFVPLSQLKTPEGATFEIKPQRTGAFEIGWSVVTRSACGETVLKSGEQRVVDVVPGEPDLVIQDFFALDNPERTIVSNNGRYRLEIYPASYRVLEVATGIKIADRAGRYPNFSPGSRFVAAYVKGSLSTGGKLEAWDLLSSSSEPAFTASGPILAWALGDALAIEGTMGHPELNVRRTLVEPIFKKARDISGDETDEEIGLVQSSASGRGSSAWERFAPKVLLDEGLVVIQHQSPPDPEVFRNDVFELASGEKLMDGDEPSEKEVLAIVNRHGRDRLPSTRGWDPGEPLRLSHFSPSIEQHLADAVDKTEGGKPAPGGPYPRQRPFLVEHSGGTGSTPATQTAALARTTQRGVLDWRARTASQLQPAPDNAAGGSDWARFAAALEAYGLCVDPGCGGTGTRTGIRTLVRKSTFVEWAFQYGSQSTTFAVPAQDLEREILKDVPAARERIKGKPNNICYSHFDGRTVGGKPVDPSQMSDEEQDKAKSFRFVADKEGHTDVHGAWSFTGGSRKYWLVQAVCSHAGIADSPVFLFVGPRDGRGAGTALMISGSAGGDTGFDKDFSGSPNEAVLRIRPTVIDGRWLLIAAPASNAAAIVDLKAPDKPTFVHELYDVFAVAHLFRSRDGRHLVQLNTDGRFYVYKTANGDDVISGRWIDDEIVLYTANNYYAGSYEGGHFVHLGFAGEPGIYSLAQFERTLNRPDIVRDVIAGRIEDGPKPSIAAPPQVSVDLVAGASDRRIVALKASSRTGLKLARIFEDGQILREVPLSGKTFETTVTLDRPPTGRWLSAIVEDTAGILSAPAQLALPPPAASGSSRTLRAVVVGVDTYADPTLKLNYAVSDARRIARALREPRGGYYTATMVSELTERDATPAAVLAALESAVAAAAPGDTVLFSFAGHGMQSTKDGQYYLTASGFRAGDPAATGLAWSRLAELVGRSKVRVLVVLDACHSASTGSTGLSTNDDAAAALLKGTHAPVLVLAASKGRQSSYEDEDPQKPRWGGGIFTSALVDALGAGWRALDANGNGALEISEIYGAVKARVVRDTRGSQTPWLVRRDLVGDFALF